MNKLVSYAILLITATQYHNAFSAIPLVEFVTKPSPTQSMKPQNNSLIFYTIKNNTRTTFPLSYSLSTNAASISSIGNTCGQAIAGNSTCVLAIQYNASATNKVEAVTLKVGFQGRAPLSDTVTFYVNDNIACTLLNTASYQTPFCQQQYQKVLQLTPNVFNTSNKNVMEEQTLGGTFGIYQKSNGIEQICYISCGLRALNGASPNENTLFELASVTKTFTASVLGKVVVNNTIASPLEAVAPYLPAGFSLHTNESPVTFQQLATFSGGVCFSDAPGVNQSSTDQALNQSHFVDNINHLNPDPASGKCSNGADNVKPVYETPPYLPSHNFYSNSSVGLLGQALMTIDGFGVLQTGFNDWMCKNVIDVLGMTRTNGCLPAEAKNGTCGTNTTTCTHTAEWTTAEYASGYHVDQGNYQLGAPFPFLPWAAAGGIRSNAVDMIQFIRANLGFATNNTAEQTQLIQGMSMAHQANNYLPSTGAIKPNIGSQAPLVGGQGYAWVCEHSPTNGNTLCGKIGGHKNFRSFLGLNLSQNYGVIILFNTGATSTSDSLKTRTTLPPTVSQIGTNLLENIS